MEALRAVEGQPVRWVIQAPGQLWREMDMHWHELPAVRDLGELVTVARKALPAPRSALT